MSVLKAPALIGRSLSTSSRRSREERHGEFHRLVERTSHEGINGHNNRVKFNSPSSLKQWWEQPAEKRIARALPRDCPPVSTIRNGYLTIFSILVFIGRPHFIGEFTRLGWQDQQLPLLDNDWHRFADDPGMTEMLHEFRDHQWRFCPVIFSRETRLDERKLDPRRILPIETQLDLDKPVSNAKSIIRPVKLYDDCCDPEWCNGTTIVLKEFQTRKNNALRDAWHQEYNAFVSIESCNNIVKYLGSFEQNDRCFIALEYAHAGNLRDLFQMDIRPKNMKEVVSFWKALVGLFKAIDHIHNLGPRMNGERNAFAHRDVNPSNILVFSDGRDTFSDSFTLKLADFDTSTSTQSIDETNFGSHDNNGSRTYSAPEASRIYPEQEKNLLQIPFNCDVWSLGCVLSISLVWLGGGMAAVDLAEQHRKDTIKTHHPHIDGSGYEACFHDGKEVLSSVLESHRIALNTLQPTDTFSRGVRDLIEKQILVPTAPKGFRSNPMEVWNEFNKIVRNATLGAWDKTYSNSTSSPSGPSQDPPSIHITQYGDNGGAHEVYRPPEHVPSDSRANSMTGNTDGYMYAKLSVNEVDNHRRFGTKKEDLPGYSSFRRGIEPRHFILIIDDSESMRQKGTEVCKTAEALLWVLKEIDSEGVEVRFTSNPTKQYGSKTWYRLRSSTRDLMKTIWDRFTGSETVPWCNMEHALNSIFDDHVVRPGRPTSVLILTDGIWEPGFNSNGGVVNTLLDVVKQMEEKRMARTTFSIQFVSFGNDTAGIKRMEYLDDDLPSKQEDGSRKDIVDHKRYTENFWAILWGAVSERNDASASAATSVRNGFPHL